MNTPFTIDVTQMFLKHDKVEHIPGDCLAAIDQPAKSVIQSQYLQQGSQFLDSMYMYYLLDKVFVLVNLK